MDDPIHSRTWLQPGTPCRPFQTAKKIAKNPKLHKHSQHVDKWIQEQIELGFINLSWVPTNENLADIFTKSLVTPHFIEHRLYLGMLV